jgi:ABC-type amino acid transport substrate-binding protein
MLALGLLAALAHATAAAGDPETMTYIVHPPESALDVRYEYHWEILQTALEKTVPKWGPYKIERSEFMTERRQTFELKAATGKLTVMYLSTTPDLEQSLVPVRIPVDRNLGGYNVLLIRKGDQARIDAARTLDDLRQLTFGLGLGWLDVEILRANGFKVVTGSSYDGLFEMLVQRRFDVFPRASLEILDEYERRKDALPDLAIEQNLVFYYPLPMYFWFSRNDSGRRLAARAEEGMRAMIADGTYDRIFDKHQRHKIETLRLKSRRVLAIENPLLGSETPFGDKKLWFDPKTYH